MLKFIDFLSLLKLNRIIFIFYIKKCKQFFSYSWPYSFEPRSLFSGEQVQELHSDTLANIISLTSVAKLVLAFRL